MKRLGIVLAVCGTEYHCWKWKMRKTAYILALTLLLASLLVSCGPKEEVTPIPAAPEKATPTTVIPTEEPEAGVTATPIEEAAGVVTPEGRHYIDLGELDPLFKGYALSFVVPAGYECVTGVAGSVVTGKLVGGPPLVHHNYDEKHECWSTFEADDPIAILVQAAGIRIIGHEPTEAKPKHRIVSGYPDEYYLPDLSLERAAHEFGGSISIGRKNGSERYVNYEFRFIDYERFVPGSKKPYATIADQPTVVYHEQIIINEIFPSMEISPPAGDGPKT